MAASESDASSSAATGSITGTTASATAAVSLPGNTTEQRLDWLTLQLRRKLETGNGETLHHLGSGGGQCLRLLACLCLLVPATRTS